MRRNGFESRTGYDAAQDRFSALGGSFWLVRRWTRVSRSTQSSTHTRDILNSLVASHATGRMLCTAVLIIIGLLVHASAAQAGAVRGTPAYCRAHAVNEYAARVCTVRVIFATVHQGEKAVAVAACESNFHPGARGPHDEYGNPRQGVWQFGTHERDYFKPYGSTVEAQTRAALRYFKYERRHGRTGWGPWDCA